MLSGILFAIIGVSIWMLIVWVIKRDGEDGDITTGFFGMREGRPPQEPED